jgi:hypothetical protein
MSDKTVVYTESAIETISAMYGHVYKLRQHYGPGSKEYTEASERLAHVMHSVVMTGFGDHATVSKDGDLSLFVNEGHGSYVYGIIWHGTRRNCTNEGCHAVLNNDGTGWAYMPEWYMCDQHVPSYPYDAPQPGSWSVHS